MVLSNEEDSKLVVVLGATGLQGGSVINHLIESERPYRLHGVTRDLSKPAAQKLVERGITIVKADFVDPPSLDAAFRGADIVFVRGQRMPVPLRTEPMQGVTNYNEVRDPARETEQGRAIVDACATAHVPLLVWSGLPDVSRISGGTLTRVTHFDSKAAVTAYARDRGVPTAVVMAGAYGENLLRMPPRRQTDGSFVLALPVSPQADYAFIHCGRDYGAFVRAAIEHPELGAGSEVPAIAEMVPFRVLMQTWGETLGVEARFVQLSKESFMQVFPSEELVQMFQFVEEFGACGPAADVQKTKRCLSRPVQSWAEFVVESDWSKILGSEAQANTGYESSGDYLAAP